MIFIFEHDTTPREGASFWWKPRLFKNEFNGKPSWRLGWGYWSISFYHAPGLREFFEHIEEGNTEWKE